MGYSVFAQYYDELTRNVDYPVRADYFLRLLERLNHQPGITLDLACGTGSLTLELYRRGVDVYGIDSSVEMLSAAREKSADAGAELLFLCQKMQKIDLYGTVDTVICALDSINHLRSEAEVRETFQRVSFFMNQGGYFLFDVNTPYKHQQILANHTFIYDMPAVYCVWQNSLNPSDSRITIDLDFFEREGTLYRRSREHFTEQVYPLDLLTKLLKESGFGTVRTFDELTFDPPQENSQRVVFAAQKITEPGKI